MYKNRILGSFNSFSILFCFHVQYCSIRDAKRGRLHPKGLTIGFSWKISSPRIENLRLFVCFLTQNSRKTSTIFVASFDRKIVGFLIRKFRFYFPQQFSFGTSPVAPGSVEGISILCKSNENRTNTRF